MSAGIIWRMIQLLFRYDSTMDSTDTTASTDANEQMAANAQAKLACYALGRLGGYFHDGTLRAAVCGVMYGTASLSFVSLYFSFLLVFVYRGHRWFRFAVQCMRDIL